MNPFTLLVDCGPKVGSCGSPPRLGPTSTLTIPVFIGEAPAAVSLAVSGLPGGVTASLSSSTVPRWGGAVLLVLTASEALSGDSAVGHGPIVVTGTCGSLVATADFEVYPTAEGAESFPTGLSEPPVCTPYVLSIDPIGSGISGTCSRRNIIATTSNNVPAANAIIISLTDLATVDGYGSPVSITSPGDPPVTGFPAGPASLGVFDGPLVIPAGASRASVGWQPTAPGPRYLVASSNEDASVNALDPPPLQISV